MTPPKIKNLPPVGESVRRILEASDDESAVEALDAVSDGRDDAVQRAALIGARMEAAGHIDAARRLFDIARLAFPEEAEARIAFARLHIARKRPETLPVAAFLLERHPEEMQLHRAIAWAHFARGDRKACRDAVERGVALADRPFDFQPGIRQEMPQSWRTRLGLASRSAATDVVGQRNAAYAEPSVATWSPIYVGAEAARLAGATANLSGAEVWFEVTDAEGSAVSRVVAETFGAAAEEGAVRPWTGVVKGLAPANAYRARLRARTAEGAFDGERVSFETPPAPPPTLETADAVPIADCGATLAGRITGATAPTRVWFAYGEVAEEPRRETEAVWIPPGASNRVHQKIANAPGDWQTYSVDSAFVEDGDQPVLRLAAPFGKDPNHLGGVGVGELLFGWYGRWIATTPDAPAARLRALDLRDAEVEVTLRPRGLDFGDWWFVGNAQSYTGEVPSWGPSEGMPERASLWSLTSDPRGPDELPDGDWTRLRFRLADDPLAWTFGGNNPIDQADFDRYTYAPLSKVLSSYRGNLPFWFLFGDRRAPPEGEIELGAIGLRWRNWSLLGLGAGAELVEGPAGSLADPALLTEGTLGDPERMWFSAPDPASPQVFVWRLPGGARPDAVRLHQNPVRPAREVAVALAAEEGAFETVWRGGLANAWPGINEPLPTIVPLSGTRARLLRLTIESGHQPDAWGLDAIEVFDDDWAPVPDGGPFSVSADVTDLEPGGTVHYRLVAESAAGRIEGPLRSVTLPAGRSPAIHAARVLSRRPGRVAILVDVRPRGLPTTLSGRMTAPDCGTREIAPVDMGWNKGVRHHVITLEADGGAGAYAVDLVVENEAGTGPPFRFEWTAM